MKRNSSSLFIFLKTSVCAAVLIGLFSSDPVKADVAADWQVLALKTLKEAKWTNQRQQRGLTILHVAMFDAANAVTGTYAPYALGNVEPSSASERAAASQAAYQVLATFVPEKEPDLRKANAEVLAGISDVAARDAGVALGDRAAKAILALRDNDGADFTPDFTQAAAAPGVYQPTSDAPMVSPRMKNLKPFSLASAGQFQVPPPPPVGSAQHLRDIEETRLQGGVLTQTDPEKLAIAKSHAGNGLFPWNKIARQRLADCQATTLEEARVLALLNVALQDSVIAGFKAKYDYAFWRPFTVIRAGGSGFGQPELAADPQWASVLQAPMHPEYPCQHCSNGAAAQAVLEAELGAGLFALTMENEPGKPRSYDSFRAYAEEEALSRIYAGVHFRWSNITGQALGRQVAAHTLGTAMTPRIAQAEAGTSLADRCPD